MDTQRSRTTPDDFRAFSQSLEGKVRSRHHAEYASWYYTTAWNGRAFERYPEYIIRAASVGDVVKTVDFARNHGLGIGAKGTGHSYAGSFFHCGGVLLDLSLLNELEVLPEQGIAIAGPGVTGVQLTRALALHGLAFPTGHGGTVGISGFLLGGGLGINCDAWGGMSTFNIQAVDVVMADGQMLHADEQQNPELLWAARGAGPCLFFAVVRFYLKCWPAPKKIVNRAYPFATADLPQVLHALVTRKHDVRLQVMVAVGGDAENLGASLSASAFCANQEEADALHGELFAAVTEWVGDTFTEQAFSGFEPFYWQTERALVSKRYRADNVATSDVQAMPELLVSALKQRPSVGTFSLIILRPPHAYPDAAFSLTGDFLVSTYAQWNDENQDNDNRDWLKALYDQLGTLATGSYINETDLEARPAAVSRCFSESAWRRLRELRQHHDSDGLFPCVTTRCLDSLGAAHQRDGLP